MRTSIRIRTGAGVAALLLGIAGTVGCSGGAQEAGRSDEPLTMAQLEQWIDQYSNSGRWGADDDIGALHLITPEKRIQAASLVRDGVSVSMAELQIPNVEQPDRSAPFLADFSFREGYIENVTTNPWTAPKPEMLTIGSHGSRSHIDGLAHNFYNGQWYNGLSYDVITEEDGATKGGIENLRHGVVTRGVLLDIPRLKGVPYLESGERIYPEDLDAWLEETGLTISPGDALFLHTGQYARYEATGEWRNPAGFDPSCIPWLAERDLGIIERHRQRRVTGCAAIRILRQPDADSPRTLLHHGLSWVEHLRSTTPGRAERDGCRTGPLGVHAGGWSSPHKGRHGLARQPDRDLLGHEFRIIIRLRVRMTSPLVPKARM